MEINYDACHVADWRAKYDETKKRLPERKGDFKVFRSVIEGHRRKPNQRIQLPARVRALLRKPADESSWKKLEDLRQAVVAEIQCERQLHFSSLELEDLRESIRTNTSRQRCFTDEVGRFNRAEGLEPVPKGSRILLPSSKTGTYDEVMDQLSTTKELEPLRIQLRPLRTKREQSLDEFGQKICFSEELIERIAVSEGMSQSECLDRLLLVLWDALMLTMCEAWTRGKVANLHACEAPQIARYFGLGLQVGSTPLFDGICSMCGALLGGTLTGAHRYKYTGPPSDRDGNKLASATGQPPCLLRYSPESFAKEAPIWFEHDSATNRLSLRPGVAKPWMRQPCPSAEADDSRPWLYCIDCKERYFPDAGERGTQSHLTYRDRASTHFMKPVFKKRYQGGAASTQGESRGEQSPEQAEKQELQAGENEEKEDGADGVGQEDVQLPGGSAMQVDDDNDEDEKRYRTRFEQRGYVPNMPDAPVQRPTLAEYQERWGAALAKHTRIVPGSFSRENLVPTPNQQLWQDVPHIPFTALRSTDSQARLSVCRPHSALEEPNARSGVGRYAHITGDAMYYRRAPQQLNSMLGFVLNQKGGRFMGLTEDETRALHECLIWGRQPGNNRILEFYGTLYEGFQQACQEMMGKFRGCIPEGCLQARIRATKRETLTPEKAGEDIIGHTLADEAIGMVIVDPSGHPMKYDGLTVLENAIATQHSRIEVDVPGPGGKGWRSTNRAIETSELDENVRENIRKGSTHILEETYVSASDAHYDARTWPCVHPYGSGSVFAEPGAGNIQRHARNRLTLIQSWFRRSPLYGFWSLNRYLYSTLFNINRIRRKAGIRTASSASDPDSFTRFFGTAQPSSIPESTEWWKKQQKELFAITDDAECGTDDGRSVLCA